ncbi:hypothetical protein ACQR10_19255 [Bradyrhizobium sp. HKCCYLRH2060]|uniref:hypothetical protein n=1 Tax=Bradyrhizobium TaxID=374 RepID=UPI002916B072|nr:hypothetical protein [Bradyrhizobium sp. SZCCHNR3003]
MTIVSRLGPSGGVAAVNAALPHLLSRGPRSSSSTLGGAKKVHNKGAIPLFLISPADALKSDFLHKSDPTAWRYPIVWAGGIALADVRADKAPPNLSALIRGPVAERFFKATEIVKREYESSSEEYEVRALEVPAMYVTALWLHEARGFEDIFFPIAEGKIEPSIDGRSIEDDPHFLDRLKEAAQDRFAIAVPSSPHRRGF